MATPDTGATPITNPTVPTSLQPPASTTGSTNGNGLAITNTAMPIWAPSTTPMYSGQPSQTASMIGTTNDQLTQGQQAAAFIDPNTAALEQQIQGIPTNNQAPQITASPLAGLTTLGQNANAGQVAINTAPSNAVAAGQMSNINMLNAQAQGQGPNPAAMQAAASGEQNVANEMAMVGSQRGSSNSSLGLRSAGEAVANANQQTAYNAALATQQQEVAAQGELQQALGTTEGQAQQGAQAQAGLQQSTTQTNAAANNQAMLQQGAMGQQTQLANQSTEEQSATADLAAQQGTQNLNANQYDAAVQAGMNLSNNDMTAAENYANLVTSEATALHGQNANLAVSQNANMLGLQSAGIAGTAALGAATATAVSDKDRKENIRSAERSVSDFLSQIADTGREEGFALWQ